MSKYIKNSIWSMIDKFLVLFSGLIAYVLVSRYLGPEDFGKLTLGVSISALGITISQWGANHTIFNSAIRNHRRSFKYISATEKIRAIIYIIFCIVVYFILCFLLNTSDSILISLVVFSHIFIALDVYQYYLDGRLQSSINAKVNFYSKVTSTILRLFFVFMSFKVYFFIIPYFIGNLILFSYKKCKANKLGSKDNYFSSLYLKNYYIQGKYFFLSGLFSFIYLKINDFLLATLFGFNEIGSLNVLLTLSFAFTFIPTAIGNTFLNKAINSPSSDNINSYAKVNSLMIFSYLPFVLFFILLGPELVFYLLGEQYDGIEKYIWIMSVTGLLSSLGAINNRIIGNKNRGSKYIFYKVIFCSLLSIPVSFLFISNHGLEGAVYSMLIMELFSLTLMNYFFDKNLIFKIHMRVLTLSPVKVVSYARR